MDKNVDRIQEQGYRRLAGSIILQALHDYEKAVTCNEKTKGRDPVFAADEKGIYRFFMGAWCEALCELAGVDVYSVRKKINEIKENKKHGIQRLMRYRHRS